MSKLRTQIFAHFQLRLYNYFYQDMEFRKYCYIFYVQKTQEKFKNIFKIKFNYEKVRIQGQTSSE